MSMPTKFVSDQFLAERYQKNRRTIWRWANDPRYAHLGFPAPKAVGPNTRRWDFNAILTYEEGFESLGDKRAE